MNENNRNDNKIIVFIIGAVIIILVLSIFAIFSSAIVGFLGFEYESINSFILYFILASILSYPLNLIAGALPKALLNLNKISGKMSICLYVLLDTATTFLGFSIVDYFMPAVSANAISLIVLSVIFSLLGMSDIKKVE